MHTDIILCPIIVHACSIDGTIDVILAIYHVVLEANRNHVSKTKGQLPSKHAAGPAIDDIPKLVFGIYSLLIKVGSFTTWHYNTQ